MTEFFSTGVFWGMVLSLGAFQVGLWLRKTLRWSFLSPLLVATVLVIVFLTLFHIDYAQYSEGARILNYLLTPATVCLAIPLYQQLEALKKHLWAILAGVLAGVVTSLGSILGLAVVFGLGHQQYVTLLPKSITTAIGIGVSQESGGLVTITVIAIILTGILGSVIAEGVCRLFRIKEPVAQGIAIGSASHAVGTTKAMEMGEVVGAMSSLSIVVSGLLTVIAVPLAAGWV